MTKLPEIALPDQLKYLVKYCEKSCDSGCCGIDAFDFSPLHVASYVSAFTHCISESDIARWESELEKAEESIADLLPNENGFICSVEGMNQYFRRADFEAFIAELRHSIRMSPKILDLSNQLRHAPTRVK